MTQDLQNVRVVSDAVKGTLATTSYGPRKTRPATPSYRPLSGIKRQLVMQLDGDDKPSFDVNWLNQTLHALPKGCFVTDILLWSETGASVTLTLKQVDGNDHPTQSISTVADQWASLRDIDLSVTARTQFAGTIGAGETAVVQIHYIQTEALGGEFGLLAKDEDAVNEGITAEPATPIITGPLYVTGTIDTSDPYVDRYTVAEATGGTETYTSYSLLIDFLDGAHAGRQIRFSNSGLDDPFTAADIVDTSGILTATTSGGIVTNPSSVVGGVTLNNSDNTLAVVGTLRSFDIVLNLADIYGSYDVTVTVEDSLGNTYSEIL